MFALACAHVPLPLGKRMRSRELVERLFVPHERWGWEYSEPSPPVLSPEEQNMPAWHEPPPPDLQHLRAKLKYGVLSAVPLLLATWVATQLLALVFSALVSVLVLAVSVTLALVLPVLLPCYRIIEARRRATRERALLHTEFVQAYQQWQDRIYQHNMMRARFLQDTPFWYPIQLKHGPDRVDVFGGTSDGWASLLVTWGSSLVGAGRQVMVLDFTEQDVAGGLEGLSGSRGMTERLDLPADTQRFNVLAGMAPDEIAELLAQAVHSQRRADGQGDLRTVDADLLETAARALDEGQPVTFKRLVAALEVLRRTYDITGDGPLSTDEVTRLTAGVDRVGQSERIQHELHFLISALTQLARDEQSAPLPDHPIREQRRTLWQPTCLTIVTTSHRQPRRKDLLDRVVFQRLLHDLRDQRIADNGSVLVVAGCDALGLEGLEALTKQCRRTGIRLMLLMERLRGELRELLGSFDSAAILMQLGNTQDAAAAAEFIGRGHKMVLSQLTAQVGRTFSTSVGESNGVSDSTSWTKGTSTTKGTSKSWGTSETKGTSGTKGTSKNKGTSESDGSSKSDGTNFSRSKNKSVTDARTRSWQETVNVSLADNTGHSTTQARVYEFTVEPTTIQALPATAFILVGSGSTGRRIVLGDCNPGIVLLGRVASPARMS
ncbi:hypothetical protein ACH4TQ_44520 [Streptomyces sp. NPDC021218]|uniref:hypothetical protein n=1 Tax=Streptomyces sp. NPDC021218 TaxID=3365119 RepID=UPI003789D526